MSLFSLKEGKKIIKIKSWILSSFRVFFLFSFLSNFPIIVFNIYFFNIYPSSTFISPLPFHLSTTSSIFLPPLPFHLPATLYIKVFTDTRATGKEDCVAPSVGRSSDDYAAPRVKGNEEISPQKGKKEKKKNREFFDEFLLFLFSPFCFWSCYF